MNVPCPKCNSTRPNIAGLMSPVQQAEMKLLLAGRWPPLKPLPVFKYETDEYRASIDFDKTRGEWVCRKTSLPSNKIEELRGGLTEMTMALPHGQAKMLAECAAAEQQEQELEKDASRRLQAIVEWRENYENGAFYSGLREYLSESQQDEIGDSIRLTLTARQLQFNPKNVAYVFDALSKAGGKLATLIEIAQRNKTEHGAGVPARAEAAALAPERQVSVEAIHPMRDRRLQMRTTPASCSYLELGGTNGGMVLNISETGMAVAAAEPLVVDEYLPRICLQLPNSGKSVEISAQIVWLAESKKSAGIRFVDLTADTRNQISNWIASEKPAPEFDGLTPAPVESLIPAAPERIPKEPVGSVFPEQEQPSSPELITHAAPQAYKIVTPEILDASPRSLVEDLQEKVHRPALVAGFAPQVRTGRVEPLADRIEDSPSRIHTFEISVFQVAPIMFLFAVISLAFGLTVGRGPLGKHLRDAQKSILAADATSPALSDLPDETTSRTSTAPAANTLNSPAVDPPAQEEEESLIDSHNSSGANKLDDATSSEKESKESARNSESFAKLPSTDSSPKPAHLPKAVDPRSGAPRNPAPRRATPAPSAAPRLWSPSTVLVRGPGDGSKPFRMIFPEKPIAASSSFAMTSQLSVVVAPEPGAEVTHESARLQAGELVSFVWPRYPRPGDRYGSSETVKVRTTIGEFGQVLDVKHVSGSTSLLPAAMSAIRLWRYKPTLLNRRPVQAQLDVTIEFRPPEHLRTVPTRHPSHN
jgi:TonB family protein